MLLVAGELAWRAPIAARGWRLCFALAGGAVCSAALAPRRTRQRCPTALINTENTPPQVEHAPASRAPRDSPMPSYLLEIVAALVASYLLTPAAATWLRRTPPQQLQQRSAALSNSAAASGHSPRGEHLDVPGLRPLRGPFCGCASAAKGTVLKAQPPVAAASASVPAFGGGARAGAARRDRRLPGTCSRPRPSATVSR